MATYDKFSKTFAKSRKNMKWPEIDYFFEYISSNLKKDSYSVLDIGCGSGRLLSYLNENPANFNYLGIDESIGMIKEAKKENPKNKFKVLNMKNLYELNDSYDLIFFIASFHHIKTKIERELILSSLKNILNKEGIIFMTNWNLFEEDNYKKYGKYYLGNGDFDIKIGSNSRYYHSFKEKEIRDLIKNADFKIIENTIFGDGNNLISLFKD